MPYLTLVSKQSTYVHVNYHQSSFHFIRNFFINPTSISLEKITFINPTSIWRKKYFSSMELLSKQRYILMDPASNYGNNYFHHSSFYCIENLISSIQLLFTGKIISINRRWIDKNNCFRKEAGSMRIYLCLGKIPLMKNISFVK